MSHCCKRINICTRLMTIKAVNKTEINSAGSLKTVHRTTVNNSLNESVARLIARTSCPSSFQMLPTNFLPTFVPKHTHVCTWCFRKFVKKKKKSDKNSSNSFTKREFNPIELDLNLTNISDFLFLSFADIIVTNSIISKQTPRVKGNNKKNERNSGGKKFLKTILSELTLDTLHAIRNNSRKLDFSW